MFTRDRPTCAISPAAPTSPNVHVIQARCSWMGALLNMVRSMYHS